MRGRFEVLAVLLLSAASAQAFMVDATREAGLSEHGVGFRWGFPTFPESFAAGACWGDYDRDGWMDLYVTDLMDGEGNGSARLYRNQAADGRLVFEDVTHQTGAGVEGVTQGCVWGDYDNDGWSDLFVTSVVTNYTSRSHVLLHNRGGTFEDVTTEAGVSGASADALGPGGCGTTVETPVGTRERCWGASAAWIDYDLDGDLDLYVLHYARFGKGTCIQLSEANPVFCEGQHNRLYRNDGGVFTDVAHAAGVATNGLSSGGRSLGVIATDINGDTWPDLWVANDMDGNALYLNNRNGTFRNAAAALNADNNGPLVYERPRYRAGMGVDAADFDNDGDMDLLSTHMVNEYDGLWLATRKGYDDQAKQLGLGYDIATSEARWGAAFADFNLDGWKDVIMVAGSPGTAAPGGIHLLLNRGGELHEATPWPWLHQELANYRGLALADFDNDGDLDVYASALPDHTGARGAKLLINEATGNWLRIHVEGNGNALDAFGARITITAHGHPTQTYTKASGGSYGSSHDPRILVGLGSATEGDILVTWPGGSTDRARFQLDGRGLDVHIVETSSLRPANAVNHETATALWPTILALPFALAVASATRRRRS